MKSPVKSPAELAYMRQAAVAVAAGMRAGLAAIREGVNEREIAAAVFPARILAGSHFVLAAPRTRPRAAAYVLRTCSSPPAIIPGTASAFAVKRATASAAAILQSRTMSSCS